MADTTKKAKATTEKADDNKLKALGLAMDQITKQFGDGSIMKLGEAHKVVSSRSTAQKSLVRQRSPSTR